MNPFQLKLDTQKVHSNRKQQFALLLMAPVVLNATFLNSIQYKYARVVKKRYGQ